MPLIFAARFAGVFSPLSFRAKSMSLRICILETDVLRPELVEQYQGYGRMFEQLFTPAEPPS